jgi:hypothetical protein
VIHGFIDGFCRTVSPSDFLHVLLNSCAGNRPQSQH